MNKFSVLEAVSVILTPLSYFTDDLACEKQIIAPAICPVCEKKYYK